MPFELAWLNLCLYESSTIQEAIKVIEASDTKICLVVSKWDQGTKLLGTITDGDVRRAILAGADLDGSCCNAMNKSPGTASEQFSELELNRLLVEHQFRHLPIVSDHNHLIGLYFSEIVVPTSTKNSLFVIMAGGFGTRLRPFTEKLPKPMVQVQGKPMIQHIIERAAASGFQNFVIILHYLPAAITDFLGDGSDFGVSIKYVIEDEPLGTAGGISLVDISNKNYASIVVTNGDLISNINYNDIVQSHIKQNSFATMAVREHKLVNEFGTVEISGNVITGFKEKPVTHSNINAGIYVLSNAAVNLLVPGKKKDMPELFTDLLALGHRVLAYYLFEDWTDVGRVADLEQVNGD